MSPEIVTLRPSSLPKRWRIVSASSRAWVGCSCAPSPALTTPAFRCRARKCGTPGEPCRMTIRSGDIAWRFRAVSRSDSPFSTELPLAAKLRESAESHFSAVSKEKRVRVEASKNRLTTIRPRSAGTFLIGRWPIALMDSAVSRRRVISSGVRGSIPTRSLERRLATVTLLLGPFEDPDLVRAVRLLEEHLDDFAVGGRHALADVVRLDRELAVAAVDEDREADGAGAPEVDDAVEGGADRPSRVEDVVAEENGAAVQVEVDLGLLQERLRRDRGKVVAVERDVEGADRETAAGRGPRAGPRADWPAGRRASGSRSGRARRGPSGARRSRAPCGRPSDGCGRRRGCGPCGSARRSNPRESMGSVPPRSRNTLGKQAASKRQSG